MGENMSHLVLYRNFRPQNFDEVIGQDHIITTLKNQVEHNSFGHAYLFCGTRGTGKTSTAKIFARAVNCLHQKNGNPCGECETCLSNLNGGNLDIVEIDAASNNRVDEIRDLREKIGYLPSVNKYKVYIVDEVHMLTDSAFNALLKTLEEPPKHAIFILATTEPHKLPATILSRCMRFDFKLVSNQDLTNHLKNVFNKSQITCDEESLKLIADAGAGSVRDTLSVAEMCSAFCNNNITYDKCLECLGITDSATILSITKCIINQDAKSLIKILDDLKKHGKNFGVVVKDLIGAINNVLSIKIAGEDNDVALPKTLLQEYTLLANSCNSLRLVDGLKTLSELDYKMKLASSAEQLVETTLLSIIFSSNEVDNLSKRIDELEKKTLNENFAQNSLNFKTASFESKVETKDNLSQEDQNVPKDTPLVEDKQYDNEKSSQDINAKKILGELLLNLRQNSQFMLYSILGDVSDVAVESNLFVLKADSQTASVISSNLKQLDDELKKINANLTVSVQQIRQTESIPTEQYLNEKFDGKLKIID